jgi:hypothetical protein
MKHLKLFAIAAIFAVCGSITSCSDDDDSESLKDILTSGNWYNESANIIMSSPYSVDTTTLEECEKDDYTVFKSDGTFTEYGGTVKCDASETDVTGTWEVADNDKTLYYTSSSGDMTGFKLKFSVTKNSSSKLTLTIDQTLTVVSSGISVTVSIKGTMVSVKK